MAHSMEILANADVPALQEQETPTGKKRKTDTSDNRPTKRRKAAAPSEKNKVAVGVLRLEDDQTVKPRRGRGKAVTKVDDNDLKPKWKVLACPKSQTVANEPQNGDKKQSLTKLRPRVWVSDRDELLSAMPELAGNKCVNGISWLLYDTPVMLLDDYSTCLEVCRENLDALTLDVVSTRSYTCPLATSSLLNDPSLMSISMEPPPDVNPDLERPASKLTAPPKKKRQIRTHAPVKVEPTHATELPTKGLETNFYDQPLPSYNPTPAHHEVPHSNSAPGRWAESGRSIVVQDDITSFSQPSRHLPPLSSASQSVEVPFRPNIPTAPSHDPPVAGPPEPYPRMVPRYIPGDPASSARLLLHAGARLGVGPSDNMADGKAYKPIPFALPPETQLKWLKRIELENSQKASSSFGPGDWQLRSPESCSATHASTACLSVDDVGPLPSFDTQPQRIASPPPNDLWPTHSPTQTTMEDLTEDVSMLPGSPSAVQNGETTQPPEDSSSSHIPSPIPPELAALIDAYIFGKPVSIIISNERLNTHWSLFLPESYGYAMLGFFKILGVEETKLQVEDPRKSGKTEPIGVYGQVRWRFRLRWVPGGERSIFPSAGEAELKSPWWKPPPPRELNQAGGVPLSRPSPSETDGFPTTPRYQEARIQHPEYENRHRPLDSLYRCFLPRHFLSGFGSYISDSAFPRGWICRLCGRLNFQAGMRHRVCDATGCKDTVNKYALELLLLRDPQDRLPVSLPYNVYPKPLEVTKATFEGGMQTISYYLKKKGKYPFIKHVFTANLPKLQLLANRVLHEVQWDLLVCRKAGDNGPYFTYAAQCPQDNTDPNDQDWEGLPDTVNIIKNMMVKRARWYAEVGKSRLCVNQLEILAWVVSGTKKSAVPIRAKKKAVVLVGLGSNIVLTVVPRSMKDTASEAQRSDAVHATQTNDQLGDDPQENQENVGWIGANPEGDGVEGDEESAGIPKEKEKRTGTKKDAQRTFVFTLVHGDALVFDGDEFEYSIKRAGTSFLLMGSYKDLK